MKLDIIAQHEESLFYFEKAVLLNANHNFDSALHFIEKSLALNPSSHIYGLFYINLLINIKNYKKANETIDGFLNNNLPESFKLKFMRAKLKIAFTCDMNNVKNLLMNFKDIYALDNETQAMISEKLTQIENGKIFAHVILNYKKLNIVFFFFLFLAFF